MFIKEISDINPTSSNKNYSFINYIDTSSVHDGNLLNVTLYEIISSKQVSWVS